MGGSEGTVTETRTRPAKVMETPASQIFSGGWDWTGSFLFSRSSLPAPFFHDRFAMKVSFEGRCSFPEGPLPDNRTLERSVLDPEIEQWIRKARVGSPGG